MNDQGVMCVVAQKGSAMTTETHLNEHAERASKDKFNAALAAVPRQQPDKQDAI
jgi:hypothetical protein